MQLSQFSPEWPKNIFFTKILLDIFWLSTCWAAGPKALEVISRLCRQLVRNVGKEGGKVMRHLRQCLGVLLVRDNVAMLCSRTPSFAPPEVDGDTDRDKPRAL